MSDTLDIEGRARRRALRSAIRVHNSVLPGLRKLGVVDLEPAEQIPSDDEIAAALEQAGDTVVRLDDHRRRDE